MASKLSAMMGAYAPQFLSQFGETEMIMVTPHGQAPREIQAIVFRGTRLPEGEFQERNVYNTMQIRISARNDVEGIVNPSELKRAADFDVFVIDGLNWGLRRVLLRDVGGMHKLLLWDGGSGHAD